MCFHPENPKGTRDRKRFSKEGKIEYSLVKTERRNYSRRIKWKGGWESKMKEEIWEESTNTKGCEKPYGNTHVKLPKIHTYMQRI